VKAGDAYLAAIRLKGSAIRCCLTAHGFVMKMLVLSLHRCVGVIALTSLLGVCGARSAVASVVVPPGLLPGDMYHLAFVTEGARNATSSDIADYNAFVQQEADRAGAQTASMNALWFALASTQAVSARVNALVQGPVYLLDGTKLADGFADFWDGELAALFQVDQFGAISTAVDVYVGGINGESHPTAVLGSDFPIVGTTTLADARWSGDLGLTINALAELPFFALSEPLFAPIGGVAPIPEPLAALTWGMLVVCGALPRRRRLG
jgi:hypothetical protein